MHAIVDSCSLQNPLLLNTYKTKKVTIEYEPNSNAAKYHHIFFLTIEDRNKDTFIRAVSDNELVGWYDFCWDKQNVFIIFKSKIFEINKENYWNTDEYAKAKKYALTVGIEEEFTDFKKYLDRYISQFPS